MICIYTGDDCSYCTCSACADRRAPVLERGRGAGQVPARPFVHMRRRPCPTGLPASPDGIVPYQPSRCANGCTCCAWCRGEPVADPYGKTRSEMCTCPRGPIPPSNCERGHSALVECRGGCKPRSIATAVVVQREGWGESPIVKLWGALRRWLRLGARSG